VSPGGGGHGRCPPDGELARPRAVRPRARSCGVRPDLRPARDRPAPPGPARAISGPCSRGRLPAPGRTVRRTPDRTRAHATSRRVRPARRERTPPRAVVAPPDANARHLAPRSPPPPLTAPPRGRRRRSRLHTPTRCAHVTSPLDRHPPSPTRPPASVRAGHGCQPGAVVAIRLPPHCRPPPIGPPRQRTRTHTPTDASARLLAAGSPDTGPPGQERRRRAGARTPARCERASARRHRHRPPPPAEAPATGPPTAEPVVPHRTRTSPPCGTTSDRLSAPDAHVPSLRHIRPALPHHPPLPVPMRGANG
jgi:hypothetical protein